MSKIVLDPAEGDVTGYGPEYYRRNRKPTEPYYVENLNFDDAVQKEHPNRDVEVEQYILNQAYKRGQDPKRPFQNILQVPDWGRGGDKVRTEYWDPESVTRNADEKAHFAWKGYSNLQGRPYYSEEPTIRMFVDNPPYIHEAIHSLQDSFSLDPRKRVKIPEPSWWNENASDDDAWGTRPHEIQAEASEAKRKYLHKEVPERMSKPKLLPLPGLENKPRESYKTDYRVEPFDKNHPAVKEGRPIPDPIINDMFKSWMRDDPHGWGDAYRDKPEDFPVELFKEALRLGQNNQKPAGMFTGRGPQNA